MKKIIFWSLPILAFFAQYILMGLGFTITTALLSEDMLSISELWRIFWSWSVIPLLPAVILPPLLLIPIAGVLMGYVYIKAIHIGNIKNATFIFYLIGVLFVAVLLSLIGCGITYIIAAMPFTYIVPLSIAAIKLHQWAM